MKSKQRIFYKIIFSIGSILVLFLYLNFVSPDFLFSQYLFFTLLFSFLILNIFIYTRRWFLSFLISLLITSLLLLQFFSLANPVNLALLTAFFAATYFLVK